MLSCSVNPPRQYESLVATMSVHLEYRETIFVGGKIAVCRNAYLTDCEKIMKIAILVYGFSPRSDLAERDQVAAVRMHIAGRSSYEAQLNGDDVFRR